MRETALNTVALMITVYTAILIWALPHVTERYTRKFKPVFLQRVALKPLVLLLLDLVLVGLLVLRPFPLIQMLLSFVSGGSSSITTMVGGYYCLLSPFRLYSHRVTIWISHFSTIR